MGFKNNPNKWDIETDVLVIGSGAAGMAAAVVAANEGAKVVLIEKTDQLGGATTMSGGGAWVPNNKFLRMGYKAEVYDPATKTWSFKRVDGDVGREMAIKYAKKCTLGYSTDELVETYVDNAWKMADYLEDNTRLKWAHTRFMPEYYPEWDGAIKAGRTIEPVIFRTQDMPVELIEMLRIKPTGMPMLIDENDKWGGLNTIGRPGAWDMAKLLERGNSQMVSLGLGLIAPLAWSCQEKGVQLMIKTPARRLVVDNGRVVGAIAEKEGKEFAIRTKKGVILCAGGFEWNKMMVQDFIRGPMSGPLSSPYNTGDGQILGMEVGARMSQMQDAWWFPTAYFPGEKYDGVESYRSVMYDKVAPGTIWVNKYGKRFTNEGVNYRSVMRAMNNYDPVKHEFTNYPAYMVFDEECHKHYLVVSCSPDQAIPVPPFKKGNTLKELAENTGIDPAGLEETVNTFNKFAKEGKDPEFHRGESYYDRFYGDKYYKGPITCLGPIEKPPFYAIEVLPGCLGTAGGVAINKKAQVLDCDNNPIPGLYAAGNNSASILGWGYPGGGSTVGPALTMGYIAGKEIVKE